MSPSPIVVRRGDRTSSEGSGDRRIRPLATAGWAASSTGLALVLPLAPEQSVPGLVNSLSTLEAVRPQDAFAFHADLLEDSSRGEVVGVDHRSDAGELWEALESRIDDGDGRLGGQTATPV